MAVLPARHDLLRKRLDLFTKMLHGVERGDVRSVHRTRVASRRLREILPVLQLDPDLVEGLNRAVRRVTRRLGKIRELDASLVLIDELQREGRYPAGALGELAAATRLARAEAGESAVHRALPDDLDRVARKLTAAADKLEREAAKADAAPERHDDSGRRPWRWAIDARVARRAGNVEQAMATAGSVYLPERLHLVRIALKKLRYALELSLEASGAQGTTSGRGKTMRGEKGSGAADLASLKRAQGALGRLHDLQILIDRARQQAAALDPVERQRRQELDRLIVTVEQECRRLHGRYVRDRAVIAAICERLIARADRPAGEARARRVG